MHARSTTVLYEFIKASGIEAKQALEANSCYLLDVYPRNRFEDIPPPSEHVLDDIGFCTVEGERWGTAFAWSKEYGLTHYVTQTRLEEMHASTLSARTKKLKVNQRCFREQDVRAALDDIRSGIDAPTGEIELEGVKLGTVHYWERIFLDEGTPVASERIERLLKGAGAIGRFGRGVSGKAQQFYTETAVRAACDIAIRVVTGVVPRASNDGFILHGELRLGTVSGWQQVLSFDAGSLRKRLLDAGVTPVEATDTNGVVRKYFTEDDVRRVIADILDPSLQTADDAGCIMTPRGAAYTAKGWERRPEANLSAPTITSRAMARGVVGFKGKKVRGQVCQFYTVADMRIISEEATMSAEHKERIRSRIRELAATAQVGAVLRITSEAGFILVNGSVWGSCAGWETVYTDGPVEIKTILRRLRDRSMFGRHGSRRVVRLYSEDDVLA